MATPDSKKPRGEDSVLGDKQEFGKHDTPQQGQDEQAREELGHMGEKSPQTDKGKQQA